MLPSYQRKLAQKSWAALGFDTSVTSLAGVGIGFDAKLDKMVGPFYADVRWTPEDDYFKRLADASRGHDLVQDILKRMWIIDLDRTFIGIEEPFPLGMLKRKKFEGSWVKQQSEVAGAFKGALAKYGYVNMYEINNAQWKATLRREGVTIRAMPEGKWDVKEWAIGAFGLPDLPDLVKGKSGGKIPRPLEGFGAKAQAVQPNDIYDAAAVCAWMQDEAAAILKLS
jgi:hypothetical protein